MREFLQDFLMKSVDVVVQNLPLIHVQQDTDNIKIVAHRGVIYPGLYQENSLAAFQAAQELGVWGIEFDIRWTKDLVPVVHHDEDLYRRFGVRDLIRSFEFAELRVRFPEILSFAEVVQRFGGKLHLMIEIKKDPLLNENSAQILGQQLEVLKAGADFHLLAIHPEVFQYFSHITKSAMLPIAIWDVQEKLQLCSEHGYGGVLGHYLLLGSKAEALLKSSGLKMGVGYIQTKAFLQRQSQRGCQWIFTNHALKLLKS